MLDESAILGDSAILGRATVPYQWQNCTIVNHRLPHGVGRATAHDATSGTPVTSFRHDTALYKAAMNANKGLDRDKDGIACEKR
ncbi:calcium-binding protein [Nocardioides pocheonensis]|uniref:Calcium-binding protein n=1 Tax=Nocardioides pocheonensis TaxID=661485 RepID=A0A3N0GVJ6_9ACTN|nr:calcium-binding protein [Nocardioides pocheonensis]